MQFKGFLKIGQSLFFCLSLAGDIDFEALGDKPIPFL